MKLDRFINRPVLSTVISIVIVILGILGLISLPISQYPDIAPPTVSVSTTYQGANAQTVLNSVVAPLEEQINGVENMMYMSSTATNTGEARIDVYFKQGTDPDMAAVNVQNRVAKAQGLLPAEVTKVGVITSKRQTSMLLVFSLYSSDDKYDNEFLENYAKINLVPEVQRVPGVGDAMVLGADYSMRIWLKPDIMAQYHLMPTDVSAALAEQNIEAAPGAFGEEGNQTFQYTLRYKGRLQSQEEFENIVIRATEDGQVLRLKDIASVELGRLTYGFTNKVNGHPAVTIIVFQTAGSNATAIINDILALLDKSASTFPPGVKVNVSQNANDFLFASIHEVVKTLIEAFILVFIVVYIFLQDLRSTLIPAIAIPVALIGTFFVLYLIGFSINLLTLCAMVLAIAIVVDDAIVVVEGVHAKLDQGYKSARLASIDAMNELGGAIVSITLVMMSVFIPVSFMSGTSGTFYRQFGLTMAIAIALSALNALTLSPALCAILLKPHDPNKKEKVTLAKRFHASFNAAYDTILKKYKKRVLFFIQKPWLTISAVVAGFALMIFLMNITPTGLVPNEDTGTIMLRYEWIWYKERGTGFLNANRAPLKKSENILVFYQKSPVYNPQFTYGKPYTRVHSRSGTSSNYGKFERQGSESNDGRRYPGNVLFVPTVSGGIHPTQKPVELCEYLIRTYTHPGELVADICAGSGTTAIAAINTERRFVCFETAPAFYAAASERIRAAQAVKSSGEKGV